MAHLSSPKRNESPTQDYKISKKFVLQYLQQEPTEWNTSKQKKDFVPYAHERGDLGNLLTLKTNAELAQLKRTPSTLKLKSTSKGMMMNIPIAQLNEKDFNFDNFRCNGPISPSTPKISYRKLIITKKENTQNTQNTQRSTMPSLSRVFRTPGRKPRQIELSEGPGVGYYETSTKGIRPKTQNVYFTRERKGKSISNQSGQEYLERDLMQTFKKVYEKKVHVPDFMKMPDRESHYYGKLYATTQTDKKETGTLIDAYSKEKIKTNQLNFLKDGPQDSEPRWKRGYELQGASMPLSSASMNEKFGQTLRKYNLYFNKLK